MGGRQSLAPDLGLGVGFQPPPHPQGALLLLREERGQVFAKSWESKTNSDGGSP